MSPQKLTEAIQADYLDHQIDVERGSQQSPPLSPLSPHRSGSSELRLSESSETFPSTHTNPEETGISEDL